MDLNSNNYLANEAPQAVAVAAAAGPGLVARDSRHAPAVIHVRNLCTTIDNAYNANLHQHQPTLNSIAEPKNVTSEYVCSSPAGPSRQNMAVVAGCNGNSSGWLDGIIGCFRPVFWNLGGKQNKGDDWEIPYEALRDPLFIGSGAQGSVYRYNWRNEVVAVKMVKDKKETDVRHMRQLNHPNIIRLRGACTHPPNYCLVMEYCPNGTLYNYLHREENQLSPRLTVDWAVQIASGMQYLHQHKIIHRDLKSPNILLADNNVLKISDFGTCRTWNDISVEMSVTGTYAWMAPEVIRKELCSQTVDVWSYGVVLWELLTSETPYRDVHHFKIIFGVGQNTLKLPLPPFAPDGFLLLMRMCWDPKPRNRPSFSAILLHLSIASTELVAQDPSQYAARQQRWKHDLRSHYRAPVSRTGSATSSNNSLSDRHVVRLQRLDSSNNNNNNINNGGGNDEQFQDSHEETNDQLIKCVDDIRRIKEVRAMYEKKLADVNSLYSEIVTIKAELEEQAKNKFKKPKKRMYKRYIVRPLQERFIGSKRSYSTTTTTDRQAPRAVFLEVDEEGGQAVSVLAPASLQQPFNCAAAVKRRSCRLKLSSHSSQHKRAWSVGGSNVHQTMMRRSESHLRRLDHVNEIKERPSSSSSNCSATTTRRCSLLVDAETQTIVDEVERLGRLKGDGVDSPVVVQRIQRVEESDESEKEVEEDDFRWERSRGRASGSSQRFATSQETYTGPGRRYTVDMSQYKYNEASFNSPQYNKSMKKAQTLPTPGVTNLSRYSSWETCSEQEDANQLERPVFDASLRRRSLGRNPIRTRKSLKGRPSAALSSSPEGSPGRNGHDYEGNFEASCLDVCGNNVHVASIHLANADQSCA